jgi:hypothetical protein
MNACLFHSSVREASQASIFNLPARLSFANHFGRRGHAHLQRTRTQTQMRSLFQPAQADCMCVAGLVAALFAALFMCLGTWTQLTSPTFPPQPARTSPASLTARARVLTSSTSPPSLPEATKFLDSYSLLVCCV